MVTYLILIKQLGLSLALLMLLANPLFANEFSSIRQTQLDVARRSFELITQNNAYSESLSSASQNVLPVGLKRVIDNTEITIAVDKAVFYTAYTELSVYAKVVIPQSEGDGRTLFFGAQGIKLSYNGSIIGDANLSLLQDVKIPFNNGNMSLVLKGNYDSRTGNSQSNTYMAIDCKGFKEFGLDAEVCFSPSLLQQADTVANKNTEVRGAFKTVVGGWNDIVVDLTLPSFRVVGLDGFVFNLHHVVFDFSDIRNSASVEFPTGYEQKYLIPGFTPLWKGVYAESLEVTLPPQFSDTEGRLTRFASRGLLIDENGISGFFKAENILSFEQGNASGWSFSVHSFSLELEANKLLAAGFEGEIGLPFKGERTRLGYEAIIQANNEYTMRVHSVDRLDFSIFNAQATILPNSYVTLHVANHQFKPEALLHGYMGIVNPGGDVAISLPSLQFKSLSLKTESPYISVAYLGYTGEVSLGSFPISLHDLSMHNKGSQVELSSGVKLTLGSKLFAGDTRLTFAASLQEETNGQRKWQFDGTRVDAIQVDASIAETIHLKGAIEWRRQDPIYGDGFFGDLQLGLTQPCKLEVSMKGCFGRVNDLNYWFVEGGVVFPVGIPVAGPLSLKGLSGAVTHRMQGVGSRTTPSGGSFSSVEYVPDEGSGLGLKAAVMISVGSIATGEACFDIAFSNSGGLNFIGFYGYAQFTGKPIPVGNLTDKYTGILDKEIGAHTNIAKLKQFEPNKAANIVSPVPQELKYGVMGSIGIQYDFRNRSLHAQTELMINAVGGFIQGVGTGKKAGWGVLHFDPSEWYVHLGAPDNRLGVQLSLGNILSIRTGSYLMAGSRIPAMPPPPIEVANLIKEDLTKLTLARNMDALDLGKGFAFGSDFQVKTGDITFLMLYANFMTGLGFDIMLKDYGDAECRGRSGAIGLDGWYAQGQAYAYLQGELGVKINLWFLKTKVPIIKGGAATLMQAMLPNPASFKGYLGVSVNVLGLIKGNVRFKLSIGEECDLIIPGSSPLEMAMISDLSPQNGDTEISVFAMPQATFNTTIGKAFEAEDDEGVGTYRIQLKSFVVTDEKGEAITGKLEWNGAKDAVSFQAKEILPPYTLLNAEIQVSFDKLENGQWKTVRTSGQEAVEKRLCKFTTGGAPEIIPMENIVYSYPVVNQRYYLPEETDKGFVQLQFGQKYLFEKGFNYQLVFTTDNQSPVISTLRYQEDKNLLEFVVPGLKKQQAYTLKIAYTPKNEQTVSTATAEGLKKELLQSSDGQLVMEGKVAMAAQNDAIEKEILNYSFATSKYRSFKQKVDALKLKNGAVAEDAGVSVRLLYKVQADEPFDEAEVSGVEKSGGKALIQPIAQLEEAFFTDVVFPMVYKGYPLGGLNLLNRDENVMGVPPHRSIFVYAPYLDLLQSNPRPSRFFFPFSYESSIATELDFRDLQSQVVNNRSMVDKETYRRFAIGRLPFLKKGKYDVMLNYVLPNGQRTSGKLFKYNNFLLLND